MADKERQYNEESKKLTDWKNEPTYTDLSRDVDAAMASQQTQMSKIDKWNNLLNVEGKYKPKKIIGRSSVQPKLIKKQAEWRYSALTEPFLSSEKLFDVNPVTFEDVEAAKQNELVLNWQFRTKLNLVDFIDEVVRTTVIDGSAILQVGWLRKTVTVQKERIIYEFYPVQNEEQIQQLQQALDLKDEDISQFQELPDELQEAINFYEEHGEAVIAVPVDTEIVEEEEVLENKPEIKILEPDTVVIDPSCEGDLDQALFIARIFETNKAELLKYTGRYKNLDKVDWENSDLSASVYGNKLRNADISFSFEDKNRKKAVAVELWSFYDIHDTGELVPIVSTWIGRTIIRMEESPMPDNKLPFVIIPYTPVRKSVYGEPDAEVLEDNQIISGALMRGMIDLLGRSANSQEGIAKGLLDTLNRRRYDQGRNYEFNPNFNPQQHIINHIYPEIPNSALTLYGMQNDEAESMTGTKAFSGGISGESYGRVVAGIKGALDASGKREMSILRRIAKGITEIGKKVIAMNQEFMSEEETIRVTNKRFIKVRRDDLQGNFDLTVDISTTEIDNIKAQDLGFILQTIGPDMDLGIKKIILSNIAELKRMPELAHKIERYEPEPDPMVQKMKELEIQGKELENAKLQAEIVYTQARANYANAIAGKTGVEAQQKIDGTEYKQKMDLQKSQSEGNKDLAVTKALLSPRKPNEIKPDIETAIGYNKLTELDDRQSDPANMLPPVFPEGNYRELEQ